MKLKGLENFLFLKKKWLSPGELFLPWHCFEQAQIRGNAHLGPLFLLTLCIPLRWLGALPFPTSSQGTTLHVCRSQTTKQAFLLLEWDKWRSFFVCLCFVLVFFFFPQVILEIPKDLSPQQEETQVFSQVEKDFHTRESHWSIQGNKIDRYIQKDTYTHRYRETDIE